MRYMNVSGPLRYVWHGTYLVDLAHSGIEMGVQLRHALLLLLLLELTCLLKHAMRHVELNLDCTTCTSVAADLDLDPAPCGVVERGFGDGFTAKSVEGRYRSGTQVCLPNLF